MSERIDIQNLIYIDGSFYRIKTDNVPTPNSDALMTSGALYEEFRRFNNIRDYEVAGAITYPKTGTTIPNQNYTSTTLIPNIKAVYDFVLDFLQTKNILDSNGNKV